MLTRPARRTGGETAFIPSIVPNGEAASMDLALVTGCGPAALADLDGLRPLVQDEDIVVFGFRDAESADAARQALAALEATGVEGFWTTSMPTC
jgi:arginase